MPIPGWSSRLLIVIVLGGATALRADEPLRMETFVEIVLQSHPASQAARAFDESAAAESRGARLLPDPTLEVSVGQGRSTTDLYKSRNSPTLGLRSGDYAAGGNSASVPSFPIVKSSCGSSSTPRASRSA